MYLHEYQAKELFNNLGIPILQGKVAYTPEQAVQIAQTLEGELWVVKAQIHAGGRGKAGGVILTRSLKEVEEAARKLLGRHLVTAQTDPLGELVGCVYVEQGCAIERELYLSLSLNRREEKLCLVASKSGGTSIEEAVHNTPEAVEQILIAPFLGIQPYHIKRLSKSLGLPGKDFEQFISNIYRAYTQFDATLIEINPLVVTTQGKLVALDAKMSLDDNAAYRQSLVKKLEPINQLSPEEKKAHEYGFSYVKLEGNIACMVNGAGLAMATMDLIHYHGGKPANFLDVGGSADQECVQVAFKLITSDPYVKAVFINIFGGIIHCDMIANSIVAVAKENPFNMPIIVRLEGTHSQEARKILSQSGLSIIAVDSLGEAALAAIQAAEKIKDTSQKIENK